MKLGLITSILGELSFEEMISYVSEIGLECVEVACWPKGDAQRRYAGVSYIDCSKLSEEEAEHILKLCGEKNVDISALAYYPNMLNPDLKKREGHISHLYKVIDASKLLHVNVVTTFIGRIPDKSVEENLVEAEKVWKPIFLYAEQRGVKIAIENCPMLFTNDEWPGGQNLMTSPANWRKVFQVLDSDCLGINFDPSHFIWQQMDYIRPIYEFKDKIFHVHCKDIRVNKDRLADVGVMATPLQYMAPKIPGHGDVEWGKFVSALDDIGYVGPACQEIEDRAYEGSLEMIKKSIELSTQYLRNYI